MANSKNRKQAERAPQKNFDAADYQAQSQSSSGLAATHEQVGDAFAEGTVDNGKNSRIQNKAAHRKQ